MTQARGGFTAVTCYQETGGGLLLAVRVQPRASQEQIVGEVEGRLRVRLTAPPVDDAANEALVAAVARWLGVARAQVALVSGARAREKRVLVRGDALTLRARLEALLGG
ncbi:MAG: DUF167 domain-containing protein [Candidatus Sericytochromatia bacterium]|nr:DUF167 domain-containing protein [Candidatus Sericytochromatia bacterium]